MQDYQKLYAYHEKRDGNYELKSYWTSSQTVEFDDGDTLEEYKTALSSDIDSKGDEIDYSLDDGEIYLYSNGRKIATEEMSIRVAPNIQLDDISNLSMRLYQGNVRFTWTDPSDVIFSELPLVEWDGTKVVRKVGSAPNSVNDGTLVLDSKVRDAYSSTPYYDNNLTSGNYYYYRFFPYDKEENYYGHTCGEVYKPIVLIPTGIPYLTETYTYTGSNITPNFVNYDTNTMTRSGTVYAKNAGTYTTTFTLKEGYKWSDDTTQPKEVTWSIGKAEGFVELDKAIVTMEGGSDTVNIISSSGNISRVYSSNESISTVSYSNDVITINYISAGSTVVNIQVDESQNYNENTITINVVCQEDTRRIHLLGGENRNTIRGHFVYNGTTWIDDVPLVSDLNLGGAVVYNNEIHVFGGYSNYTDHHKLVNGEWVSDVNCPKFTWHNWRNSAVIYNNEIHILAAVTAVIPKDHYKFDGTNWTSVSTVPSDVINYVTLACANNILYLFGHTSSNGYGDYRLYKYNNGWELISTPEWGLNTRSNQSDACCFEYNNCLHVATMDYIYKYSNGVWTTVTDTPTGFGSGDETIYVVQNNKINMIRKYDNKNGHYCYNGSTWDLVSEPLYSTSRTCAVVY